MYDLACLWVGASEKSSGYQKQYNGNCKACYQQCNSQLASLDIDIPQIVYTFRRYILSMVWRSPRSESRVATPPVPLCFSPQRCPGAPACGVCTLKLLSNDVLMTTDARRCRDGEVRGRQRTWRKGTSKWWLSVYRLIARLLQPFVVGNCINFTLPIYPTIADPKGGRNVLRYQCNCLRVSAEIVSMSIT